MLKGENNMSADNWRVCPRCKRQLGQEMEDLAKKLVASYGKVPESEYLEILAHISEPRELDETLREDYEQFISEDGYYRVVYSCHCSKCGFSFKFKHGEFAPEFSKVPE